MEITKFRINFRGFFTEISGGTPLPSGFNFLQEELNLQLENVIQSKTPTTTSSDPPVILSLCIRNSLLLFHQ